MSEIELQISGMRCANCAARLEKVLNQLPDVQARVNIATEKASIRYQTAHTNLEQITQAIIGAGFNAQPVRDFALEKKQRLAHYQSERRHCYLAAILTLPMWLEMLWMMTQSQHGLSNGLPIWLSWLLATLLQFWFGARFYHGAWASLRSGGANMDVLVVLGTSAAYFYSCISAWQGAHAAVYFESSSTLITFILFGKFLELRAKQQASSALESLMQLQPSMAHVEVDGEVSEVPVSSVKKGDVFWVRAGQSVPVDGEIIHGESQLDESMLSGESLPNYKQIGDKVYAATLNLHTPIQCRAIAVGAKTQLAAIIRCVEQAQGSKAAIQHLADKISQVFVPIVVLLAVLTGGIWWLFGASFNQALMNAVAVLVISCPCALGLATPAALVVATGRAAQLGILIKDANALERAYQLRTLVVDKTGTLTEGKPSVCDIQSVVPSLHEQGLLQLAASFAQHSNHPLSVALQKHLSGVALHTPEHVTEVAGQGLEVVYQGKQYRLGALVAEQQTEQTIAWQQQGKTVIALSCDHTLLGYIALVDKIRDTTTAAVQRLQSMGIRLVMISGDNLHTTQAIAQQVGIVDFYAQVLPQDKAAKLNQIKADGALVGMVGDGINDAPALAAADVSFAMRSGSDIAIAAADMTLMHNDLASVVQAIKLSHVTLKKIRQNLFLAFLYNVLAIPLAALGMLNPMIAGAAMALSSVSVVTNALLLRHWRG